MKSKHTRFPTYKTKKQSPCNDFQNQYRNEIKELISGTDYLDQFIKSPAKESRNENNSRNFNSMTPESKRKLMFQKPVTLVKRQTKYYSNHAKTPTKSKKQDEKVKSIYFRETPPQENMYNSEKLSNLNQISPICENQIEQDSIISNNNFKSPSKNTVFHTPQKLNIKSLQSLNNQDQIFDPEILTQEDQKEYDSYSLEIDEIINPPNKITSNMLVMNNEDNKNQKDQLPSKEKKNKGFNYFQISFDQEDQNDNDFSDSNFEKNNDLASDANSFSEIEPIKKESKIPLSQNKKAIIMISSDAIEAEVNYTSDSSSDFEFQSQFFVQEKVIKPNSTVDQCGKFISSEAIESFSDE